MSEALKARLIGAVVLVVVGFVALNALLGGLGTPEPADDEPVVVIRPDAQRPTPVRPAPSGTPSSRAAPDASAERTSKPSPKTKPQAAEPARSALPEPAGKPTRKPAPKPEPESEPAPRPEPKPESRPEPKPAPKPAPKPQPKSAPAAEGTWFVQVASFGNPDNAARMVARLRNDGFDAASDRVTVQSKTYVRVVVGPYADAQAAERAKARIAVQYGQGGRVIDRS